MTHCDLRGTFEQGLYKEASRIFEMDSWFGWFRGGVAAHAVVARLRQSGFLHFFLDPGDDLPCKLYPASLLQLESLSELFRK